MSCPERQELVSRLRAAFTDFSAAVREQRNVLQPPDDANERSVQAQKACERVFAELQEHQSRHKCWP